MFYVLIAFLLLTRVLPYILFAIVGGIVELFKAINKSFNQPLQNIFTKSNVTTSITRDNSKIIPKIGNKSQGKKLWKFIISLEKSDIPNKDRISSQLKYYRICYWEKNAEYKPDLYTYILKIANAHAKTQSQFYKKDCEVIIRITQLLQRKIAIDEIIRLISKDTGIKETKELTTLNEEEKESITSNSISIQSEKLSPTIPTADNVAINGIEKHTQALGNPIQPLDDITTYKIVSRLLSYNVDFLKKKNTLKPDLYDFILESTKERINTAKRDYVKRECKIVTQIVQLLKEDAEIEDILHMVFPTIKKETTKEAIAKGIEEIRKIRNDRQSHIVRQTVIPQLIYGLRNNAISREEDKLREQLQVIHQRENLEDEIVFIKKTIQHNKLLGMPYEYWDLLLKKQTAETEKQKQIVRVAISQIILALEDNASHRESLKKAQQKKEIPMLPAPPKKDSPLQSQSENKPDDQPPCQWISPEEIIEVQGIKLKRGNFYLGEHFVLPPKTDDFSYFGAYIFGPVLNPTFEIENVGILDNKFSSYKDMTPYWRYQYLMWLSGDVEVSAVPVEILLFYLYGYEIKMFVDGKTTMKERQDILTGVIQLQESLGKQYDKAAYQLLQKKLDDFIGHTIVKFFNKDINKFSIKSTLLHCELYKQAYIIHKLKDDERILSVKDAYAIANEIYDIDEVVPTKYRAFAEKYFSDEYIIESKKIAEILESSGIVYYNHCDASYCYNNYCNFSSEKIEIFHIVNSSTKAGGILHVLNSSFRKIQAAFGRYNYIKKGHKGQETIAAITFLPDEIDIKEEPKIKTLIAGIEKIMQQEMLVVLNVDEILNLWEYEHRDAVNLPKEYIDSIIYGFRRLGYGVVPNYEIDTKRFNYGDICVIYKDDTLQKPTVTNNYMVVELFIQLAVYIMQADKVFESDFVSIENYIQAHCTVDDNPNRLMAVAKWRLRSKKQSLNWQLKSAISKTLSEKMRPTIGNDLIRLLCTNGDIRPKRIEGLKKILPLLGMETNNIHSQIHRFFTDSEDFATIEKKTDAIEFHINNESSQVIMNPEKLRILEQQTEENRKLLSNIFGKEDETIQDIVSENQESKWMDILKLLFTKKEWKRTEVEMICKERKQMLGAVLEQINDFAYSKIDDAVVEDDEEYIYVILEYKDQLI